ncbi:MAG: hypothetical protein EPO06_00860 [Burkholderiaceae bacterium]|nr:MAG: hypothetical protein EPO06_00860 [Burkholderiaceae bacterium]
MKTSSVGSTVKSSRKPPLPVLQGQGHAPAKRQRAARPRTVLKHVTYPDCFALLSRFAQAMDSIEQPIDLTRMQYDRLYGLEQLNLAHASGDQELRQMAVVLTLMYDTRRV